MLKLLISSILGRVFHLPPCLITCFYCQPLWFAATGKHPCCIKAVSALLQSAWRLNCSVPKKKGTLKLQLKSCLHMPHFFVSFMIKACYFHLT